MTTSEVKLSGEEAAELSSVFGPIEPRRLVLLLLFAKEPRSQYDLLPLVDPGGGRWKSKDEVLPREYRIPRATLYRMVPELEKSYFLIVDHSENRTRGKQTTKVDYYSLTHKGRIAALLGAYVAYSQSNPNSGRKLSTAWSSLRKRALEWIREHEEDEYWPIAIDFLEWHKESKTDLSRAEVSPPYAFLTSALRAMERQDKGGIVESDWMEEFLDLLRDHLLTLTDRAFRKKYPTEA